MDFTAQFLHTAQAMAELFIMTLVGYIIVKKRLIDANINDMLCRFLIDVALPLFIFAKIIQDFRFQAFPHWWLFPFLSIVITIIGFATGKLLTIGSAARARKAEFVSIITFQNSGYLPLGLVALLFPPSEASVLFVYIFLFLIGFNAVMFSYGVNMLSG